MQAILDIHFRQDVFFLFGMRKVISKTTCTTNVSVLKRRSPVDIHLNLQNCAPREASLVGVPPGAEVAA